MGVIDVLDCLLIAKNWGECLNWTILKYEVPGFDHFELNGDEKIKVEIYSTKGIAVK